MTAPKNAAAPGVETEGGAEIRGDRSTSKHTSADAPDWARSGASFVKQSVKVAILQAFANQPAIDADDVINSLSWDELDRLLDDTARAAETSQRRIESLEHSVKHAADRDERRLRRKLSDIGDAAERAHRAALPAAELSPHGYFTYVLWEGNTPIYVGQSRNVAGRLGSHMADHDKRKRTDRITVKEHETEPEMTKAESELIARFRPELNTRGIPDRREGGAA